MKDYDTAIKFERAMSVLRLLEIAGKSPTLTDIKYINELRYRLDRPSVRDLERWWNQITRGRKTEMSVYPDGA